MLTLHMKVQISVKLIKNYFNNSYTPNIVERVLNVSY